MLIIGIIINIVLLVFRTLLYRIALFSSDESVLIFPEHWIFLEHEWSNSEAFIIAMNVSMVGKKVSCWWDWFDLLMLSVCYIVLINQYFKMFVYNIFLNTLVQIICQ
jgi:hypothetical protein